MFKFELGQEVIYDGEVYKVRSRSYSDDILMGNKYMYYTIEDAQGCRPFIYENMLKEKPKYKITIQDGDKTKVIYAEDFIMKPKEINVTHCNNDNSEIKADGREIDELWGVKLGG